MGRNTLPGVEVNIIRP